MGFYCQIETKNHGQFFNKCGTKEVANRCYNTDTKLAGPDYTLVHNYAWEGSPNASTHNNISCVLSISVPAFPPSIASALEILNANDEIKELKLQLVQNVNSLAGKGVIGTYTAKSGTLISANCSDHSEGSQFGELHLSFEFQSMLFENKMTHTSGLLSTVNAGAE
jgi:hypothetical protein